MRPRAKNLFPLFLCKSILVSIGHLFRLPAFEALERWLVPSWGEEELNLNGEFYEIPLDTSGSAGADRLGERNFARGRLLQRWQVLCDQSSLLQEIALLIVKNRVPAGENGGDFCFAVFPMRRTTVSQIEPCRRGER